MSLPVDKSLQIRAAILQDMNTRWSPHGGQSMVRQAVHSGICSHVFLQCGRKYGKTDFLLREGVENCLLPRNAGEVTYYMAYESDQAKEIVWLERRPHKMCHPSLIEKVYETDMRIVYKNGRQLIVGGSNNYAQFEGVRPSLVLMDEFKRFRSQLWEVMEPNMSVYNATAIFAGSPPDQPCQYTELADFVKFLQESTGEGFHVRHPSWMNNKQTGLIKWLMNRKQQYIARGEYQVWQREYEALYVPGGEYTIFPMFNKDQVGRTGAWMRDYIKNNGNHMNWFCLADPATESVFGVLFAAVHPETKHIFLVDSIYETNRNLTSTTAIWQACKEKINQWHPYMDDWYFAYDDHEGWFQIESQKLPDAPNWMPVGKYGRSKEAGVSTIKDILLHNLCVANDETMGPWYREMQLYVTDQNGKIPKGRDHLIDLLRYLVVVSNYDMILPEKEEIPEHIRRDPWLLRAVKQQENIESDELQEDWTHDMFGDWARAA